MKQIIFLMAVLLAVHIFPVETIVFNNSESIDFLEKMESHDYFFKKIFDCDVDENNHLYLLDPYLGTVLRIDANTGKLINSISRKGQGPAELQFGNSIRVKNNLVFVTDEGFSGVKIFEKTGKLVKEFRTRSSSRNFCIDVDRKNKIFLKQHSSDGSPNISVYNIKGERMYEFVKFPVDEDDRREYMLYDNFIFKLDKEENMVVLFLLKKMIKKFNRNGQLLWEKEIKNRIIDKYDTGPNIRFNPNGSINYTSSVFDLDIDGKNNIYIGHVDGGAIYDKNGTMINLIDFEPIGQLNQFLLYDKKLLQIVVWGLNGINIFKFNPK